MDWAVWYSLQRLQEQIADLKDETHEIKLLTQRLAIIAGLWGVVSVLGYNSPLAQELVTNIVRSYLSKH